MKKITAVLISAFMLFTPCSVYAAPEDGFEGELENYAAQEEVLPLTEVYITGDIDFEKDSLSTFDNAKTISGTAEEGTKIIITVSTKNAKGELKVNDEYEFTVGISGLFSQSIDLSLGENIVDFKAEYDECFPAEYEVVVKRKKAAIKDELEKSVALPGEAPAGGIIIISSSIK